MTGWVSAEAAPTAGIARGGFARGSSMRAHVPKVFMGKGNSDSSPSAQGISGNKERSCIINGVKQRDEAHAWLKY